MAGRAGQQLAAQRRRPAADVVPSQPMQLGGPWSVATAQPDPQFGENYQLNKRLIEAMAGIAQQNGIQFILVSIGQLYRPEEIAAAQAIDPSYDPAYFDSDLADLAAKDGFMHAGLYEVFGNTTNRTASRYAGHIGTSRARSGGRDDGRRAAAFGWCGAMGRVYCCFGRSPDRANTALVYGNVQEQYPTVPGRWCRRFRPRAVAGAVAAATLERARFDKREGRPGGSEPLKTRMVRSW